MCRRARDPCLATVCLGLLLDLVIGVCLHVTLMPWVASTIAEPRKGVLLEDCEFSLGELHDPCLVAVRHGLSENLVTADRLPVPCLTF